MGIKGFSSWLRHTFPDAFTLLVSKPRGLAKSPSVFEQVYVDLNPFLHIAARQSTSKEQVWSFCRRQLRSSLLSIARPRSFLCIAMDGVAPLAKLPEQRLRRQDAAQTAARRATFDTQQITPGCVFMTQVEGEIYSLILDLMRNSRNAYFKKAILDGSGVAGEGEFKLFRRLINDHLQNDFMRQLPPSRIVLASDADSLLQAILCDIPNVFILDPFVNNNGAGYSCFAVDKMRQCLAKSTVNDPLRVRLQCLDLALFALFSGSDYAPSLKYANFRSMWPAYMEWHRQSPSLTVSLISKDKKSINLQRLGEFFTFYLDRVFPSDLLRSLRVSHEELDPLLRKDRIVNYLQRLVWNMDALITGKVADDAAWESSNETKCQGSDNAAPDAPSLLELAALATDNDTQELQQILDKRSTVQQNYAVAEDSIPAVAALMCLVPDSDAESFIAEPLRPLLNTSLAMTCASERAKMLKEAVQAIPMEKFSILERLATFSRPPMAISSNSNADFMQVSLESVLSPQTDGCYDDALSNIPWIRPYLCPIQ